MNAPEDSQYQSVTDISHYQLIGYRIVTPFHFAGLLAYAYTKGLLCCRQTIRILVISGAGPWGKTILPREAMLPQSWKVTIDYVSEEQIPFINYKRAASFLASKPFIHLMPHPWRGSSIPVCSPSLASWLFAGVCLTRKSLFSIKPVEIDEGLGTFSKEYLSSIRATRVKGQFHRRAVAAIVAVFNQVKWVWGEAFTLFKMKKGKFRVEPRVASAYRYVFYELAKAAGPQKASRHMVLSTPSNKSVVLILTQPLDQIGACSTEEIRESIQLMVDAAKAQGCTPLLKLHPAECGLQKYGDMDAEILQRSEAVEEFFAQYSDKITEVWGFTSTALITAPVMFQIPSRRLIVPWAEKVFNEMPIAIRVLFDDWVGAL